MMAQQNVSACSLLKQQLLTWSKRQPLAVRDHAQIVADNLKIIERGNEHEIAAVRAEIGRAHV